MHALRLTPCVDALAPRQLASIVDAPGPVKSGRAGSSRRPTVLAVAAQSGRRRPGRWDRCAGQHAGCIACYTDASIDAR